MVLASVVSVGIGCLGLACESSSEGGGGGFDAGPGTTFEAGVSDAPAPVDGGTDSALPKDAALEADAAKVLAEGLSEPIPYLSRADSLFNGVSFPSYLHFEDWEDGLVNTPGVTPSSTQVGASFGAALVDSVDGDDGVIDGKCEKVAGTCNSGFAGGTIDFTFDAVTLGNLPTHVGIVWTDGSPGCDAIFEAYDAADALIGSKTAAGVGDATNYNTVAEDRFFSVVHAAGVKRIVVKSSSGGIEVDHLQYGR
jgi:hypothetical protein